MATNKRKESAALFELIGKSTLKVPKSASALKIPEWWSSKTNPPTAPSKTAALPPEEDFPAVATTGIETSAEAMDATVPAQQRLFDPPPSGADSVVSPSIRPPAPAGANGSSTPAALRTSPAESKLVVTSDTAAASTLPAPSKPARPNPVRIFAPQTMSQSAIPSRRGGTSGTAGDSYRRNGRIPLWALIMAVALLLLIVITVVAAIYTWTKSRQAPSVNHAAPSAQSSQQTDNVILPPTASLLPPSVPVRPPVNNTPVPGNTADAASAKGSVYGPGVIQRSSDLYYVIITQTPTASVAQKDADFLADHGIDVSIEITSPGPGGKGYWYRLVSVQGYPTLVTANPFRKKIVLIGHLHDDFKKGKPMWDDAFLARVKATAPQSPAR